MILILPPLKMVGSSGPQLQMPAQLAHPIFRCSDINCCFKCRQQNELNPPGTVSQTICVFGCFRVPLWFQGVEELLGFLLPGGSSHGKMSLSCTFPCIKEI